MTREHSCQASHKGAGMAVPGVSAVQVISNWGGQGQRYFRQWRADQRWRRYAQRGALNSLQDQLSALP